MVFADANRMYVFRLTFQTTPFYPLLPHYSLSHGERPRDGRARKRRAHRVPETIRGARAEHRDAREGDDDGARDGRGEGSRTNDAARGGESSRATRAGMCASGIVGGHRDYGVSGGVGAERRRDGGAGRVSTPPAAARTNGARDFSVEVAKYGGSHAPCSR